MESCFSVFFLSLPLALSSYGLECCPHRLTSVRLPPIPHMPMSPRFYVVALTVFSTFQDRLSEEKWGCSAPPDDEAGCAAPPGADSIARPPGLGRIAPPLGPCRLALHRCSSCVVGVLFSSSVEVHSSDMAFRELHSRGATFKELPPGVEDACDFFMIICDSRSPPLPPQAFEFHLDCFSVGLLISWVG